ncbi:unnamed protein product, partial [Rotaria magnacalcarata]
IIYKKRIIYMAPTATITPRGVRKGGERKSKSARAG